MGSNLLQTPLVEITDADLLAFVRELEGASKVLSAHHPNLSLYNYVWQCVYPWGAGDKRYPLDKNRINPVGMLSRRIKKLQGSQVYEFCNDLAKMQNQTAELVENMTLYVFLNRYLPDLDKKKKPKQFDPRDLM